MLDVRLQTNNGIKIKMNNCSDNSISLSKQNIIEFNHNPVLLSSMTYYLVCNQSH